MTIYVKGPQTHFLKKGRKSLISERAKSFLTMSEFITLPSENLRHGFLLKIKLYLEIYTF